MPFTIQLHPENDADIIDYLSQQENKQAAIKDALRSCINGPPLANENDDLRTMFGDLKGYLDQKFAETQRLIKTSPPRAGANDGKPDTPELDQGMRKALIKGFKPGA